MPANPPKLGPVPKGFLDIWSKISNLPQVSLSTCETLCYLISLAGKDPYHLTQPVSVDQLSALTRKPKGTLYRHLAVLLNYQFIRLYQKRKGGQTIYEIAPYLYE